MKSILVCAFAYLTTAQPIFDAVYANDIKLIQKEIHKKDFDINQKGPGGQTPLMAAVLKGKFDAFKHLLGHGADVFIGENDGYTPVHGAGF